MLDMSKRNLLKGSGLLTLSMLSGGARQALAQEAWDIIVVGGGTAGMPVAIFAAERGARVLVIDKAPVLGGTLDRSTGQMAAAGSVYQKARNIKDSPDAHYEDIMRINGKTSDPALCRLFVDNAADTINWLAKHGFEVHPDHPVLGGGHEPFTTRRYLWAKEGGGKAIFAVMSPLFDAAVKAGRASGGCAANPTMYQELHGVPLWVDVAYPYSQGDGIMLGVAAGGHIRGGDLYAGLFSTVVQDKTVPSPSIGGIRTAARPDRPLAEVYVNARGERFVQEDHPSIDHREKAVVAQPGQRFWAIFDHAIFSQLPSVFPSYTKEKLAEAFNSHPMFFKGETLSELGVRAGVDPARLQTTVAAYNTALESGAPDPLGRKDRPMVIAKPPFYAIRTQSWTVVSFAGLAVDTQLRVTQADGRPVPNLYAVGEVIGGGATSGHAYTNGMLVTPALTFGRLLGSRILPVKKA
jgi:fumarate reductase flavoprotein subunit